MPDRLGVSQQLRHDSRLGLCYRSCFPDSGLRVTGSSRAIYFTICSRSFLLRAEKITSQAMSARPGEVGPHCRFALGQCPARLHRVTPADRRAPLRLEHPSRIVARAISIPEHPAQQQADLESLVRFARYSCSSSLLRGVDFSNYRSNTASAARDRQCLSNYADQMSARTRLKFPPRIFSTAALL